MAIDLFFQIIQKNEKTSKEQIYDADIIDNLMGLTLPKYPIVPGYAIIP